MAYIQNPVDLFAKDPNNEARRLICDLFGFFGALSPEHYWGHLGYAYDTSVLKGDGEELADDGSLFVYIQCASASHLIFECSCGGNAEVYFYKNPVVSTAGTAMTVSNKSEYSSNTSSNTVTHTPVFGSPEDHGTLRFAKLLPGGTKKAGSGGADGSFDREIILKAGNNYLIQLKNISGVIQPASITVEWYEPQL